MKLEIEWDYKPLKENNRKDKRISGDGILKCLFDDEKIVCKFFHGNVEYSCELIDLSCGGIKIKSKKLLTPQEQIVIMLSIGKKQIKTVGEVRYSLKNNSKYDIGIMFMGKVDCDFVNSLVINKIISLGK